MESFDNGAPWVHKETGIGTRVIGVITDKAGHAPSFEPGTKYVLALGIDDAPHDVWELNVFKDLFEYALTR